MAVKQKAKKRTRKYYERTYRAIGLEAVKCLLCGEWFGVKANIFNLNLLCESCKVKFYSIETTPNKACTGQEPAAAVKDNQVIGSCQ